MTSTLGASITFLGATQVVTGSRFLVSLGRIQGLVECGLFQGAARLVRRNWAPPPFDPAELEWVVLTHAHLDHAGYLPRLARLGFHGPVYATPATLDLARVLLVDAGSVQEEDAASRNAERQRSGMAQPLYTAADARACLAAFRPIEYEQALTIAPGIRLRLREAGHILGSAIVELWLDAEVRGQSVKIVFSGDLGRPEAGLLRSPAVIETADELVLESTYGNRAHPAEPAEEVLARALGEALAAGGRLLIPAFAVGRAQEVLFSLRVLQASGRVPAVPIYLDSPLAREATALFAAYPDYLGPAVRAWLARPAPDRDRQAGPVHFVALRAATLELVKQEGPLVVIAGSGMATGGRVLNYLRAWLPDPRSVVLFPGYQARGTPGRMLVDGARTITIRGERLPVRARIRHSDAFSAHADAPAILRWLTRLHAAPRRVFLVHGEPRATGALARRIRTELGWQTCVPDFGQRIRFDIRAERSRP